MDGVEYVTYIDPAGDFFSAYYSTLDIFIKSNSNENMYIYFNDEKDESFFRNDNRISFKLSYLKNGKERSENFVLRTSEMRLREQYD